MIAPDARGGSDLVRLLNVILRNRLLLLGIPLLAAVSVALILLIEPAQYRSEASFVPQTTQRTPPALSGLAAQFGLAMPSDGFDQSPAFYEDVIRSREILERVVQEEYSAEGDEVSRTLIELFQVNEGSARANVHAAAERVRRSIQASADNETGVVYFSVPAEQPALARQIAEQIIAQINIFNLTRRQNVAESERTFIEARLAGANQELVAAEMELRRFDERNLRIDNSPELRMQRERLQRLVGMRQEVVTMLSQAYEQARIDEVRNTPAITVIERPSLPVERASKGILQFALLALIVTGVLMSIVVFAREAYHTLTAGQTPAHREFRELRARLVPWKRLRRER